MKPGILAVLILALPPDLASEASINILKPYTAIYEAASVKLHHIVNGRWVNEFLSEKSVYEIRKLDYSSKKRNRQGDAGHEMAACTDMRITEIASHIHFIEHCYSVKEIPSQGEPGERSEMCSEYYFESEIVSVDCRVLSFQPNGTFQSRQWIMSDKAGQDAVLQSSGNCSVRKQ